LALNVTVPGRRLERGEAHGKARSTQLREAAGEINCKQGAREKIARRQGKKKEATDVKKGGRLSVTRREKKRAI
jgi:hypothetical protein